jgi:predicted transcriptional regulator
MTMDAKKLAKLRTQHGAMSKLARDTKAKHPDWGWSRIARELGMTPQGVKNACLPRNRLGAAKQARAIALAPNKAHPAAKKKKAA